MSAVLEQSLPVTLEERLENGADLLFGMEQQGQTGENYQRWLSAWLELLSEYESLSPSSRAA